LAGGAGWGAAGGGKFNILNGAGGVPLGLAAGLSYAWAGDAGEAPLDPGRGIGLCLPLSLEFSSFSVVFSPGARWPVPEDFLPQLLISAGVLYRGPWYTAGFSLRPEFDFTDFARRTRLLTAAEVRFYPPPSHLVFSLLGGAWLRGGAAGGFGGIGIGILY
jgi:hypothetical protein